MPIQLRLHRSRPGSLQTAALLHWAGWDVTEDGAWLVADSPLFTTLHEARRELRRLGLARAGVECRTIRREAVAGLRLFDPW